MDLSDVADVYEAATETKLPAESKARLGDDTFRMYLDFLHMQGVITHSNAPMLEDLVIIDPMWLLRQVRLVNPAKAAKQRPVRVPRPQRGDGCLPKRPGHRVEHTRRTL